MTWPWRRFSLPGRELTTTQTTTGHNQHTAKRSHGTDRKPQRRVAYSGGAKRAPASVITQGTPLPPDDRSSDRNEQHCAAPGYHPANTACPRRAARSRTCLHLLITGSPVPRSPSLRPSSSANHRRQDWRPGREGGRGVGGVSCWGPFGDHTSCTDVNNPHMDHPCTGRLHPI
jgi:hypothetical protein